MCTKKKKKKKNKIKRDIQVFMCAFCYCNYFSEVFMATSHYFVF